jgi:hypothetical protein
MNNDLQKAITGALAYDSDKDPKKKEKGEGDDDGEESESEQPQSFVEIGDYVSVGPLFTVYQLDSAEWKEVKDVQTTVDHTKVCNIEPEKCVAADSCSSVEAQINDAAVDIRKVESNVTGEQANNDLRDAFWADTSRVPKLEKIYKKAIALGGGDLAAQGYTEERATQSPHLPLLQAIMAQGDFATKQLDLLRFEREFTIPGKTEWVRACKDTGVPLLPTFFIELANAFQRGEYSDALDKVCATRGRLSDMGDAWIDVHSGFIIKRIDDVVDPSLGVTEDLPEAEQISLASLLTEEVDVETAEEGDIARQVVKGISAALGIQLSDAQMEFIQGQVAAGLTMRLPNRTDYENRRKRAKAKTGKTLPSYEYVSENMTVMLAMSALLIAVQTAEVPHRIKRVIAGCPRSLRGYPLNPDVNEISGVRTIACTANRIKTDNLPWTTLAKLGEEALIKQLMKFVALMVETPSVAGLLDVRRSQIGEEELDTQDDDMGLPVTIWPGYLPPVDPPKRKTNFSPKTPQGLDSSVPLHVYEDYTLGFDLQAEQREIIRKSRPQLITVAGTPYTNNACCAGERINPRNINELIKYSNESDGMRQRLVRCFKAEAALLTRNTRPIFPPMSNEYSQETKEAIIRRYCGGDAEQSATAMAADACKARGTRISDVLDSVFENNIVEEPRKALVMLPSTSGFAGMAFSLAELCKNMAMKSRSKNWSGPTKEEVNQAVELREVCSRNFRATIDQTRLKKEMRAEAFENMDKILNSSTYEEMSDVVEWCSRLWPSFIANNVSTKPPKIGRHLGLSKRHQIDIQNLSVKQLEAFTPFYDSKTLLPLLKASYTAPSLATLLFRTSESVLYNHIDSKEAREYLLLLAQSACYISYDYMRFADPGAARPKDLGPLIVMFVKKAETTLTSTRLGLENLRRRLLVAKEKEKAKITDFLKDMSDEQREIENLMKNNKLGKWSKGQSKEIFAYTRDAYDSEMAAIEAQESEDVQFQDALGRVRVGEELADFYSDPDVREALDLSGLPEDDDFGDRDGDEDF